MPDGLYRHVPNLLTIARLVLSFVFFGMLAWLPPGGFDRSTWYLDVAFGIYVVAAATDWLDGYLARRWNVVTVFGRVVDPFVDKILVLGAFIYFAGPRFTLGDASALAGKPITLTGVTPTIVVILLSREFLVTTLRSVAEGAGSSYAAQWTGKLKMVLQCVTIGVILLYVNYRPNLAAYGHEFWFRVMRDVFVWATVAVTVLSAWTYVQRTMQVARGPKF